MEYISNLRWENLADVKLELRNIPTPDIKIPLEPCVIHFHPEFTYQVFDILNQIYDVKPSIQYVLISSDGDCGVCYQHENRVAEDFKKAIYMVNIEELGYEDLHLQARCDKSCCNMNDLYSVKMYAFTYATFANLPPNVHHWYLPNCDVEHKKFTCIPFGIPPWFEDIAEKHFVTKFDKSKIIGKKIHVAFNANTVQRHEILNSLQTNESYIVRKETVPHKQYVEDLLECGFSLSPHGNGLDCYRNLEAIYMGRVPLMPFSRMNEAYRGLPYINFGQGVDNLPDEIDLEGSFADMSYWRERINRDRIAIQ